MRVAEPTDHPKLDRHQARTRRTIAVGSRLSPAYLIMNALATIVASYGLLANSTAVVIGAMLIAMLLGPIVGLALALVDGDTKLLRHAILAEAVGVALVVAVGYLVGRLHFEIDISSEILSRTRPNLLDLAIAVAGGAAGAYAIVSPRLNVGVVGVAISTALVPPLASCGICLSRGLTAQAGGAFVLFATNLVAIQVAASVVLFLFGFHNVTRRHSEDRGFVRRLVLDAALFLVLSVFLYVQLARTIEEQRFEKVVRQQLTKGLVKIAGAYLAEAKFVRRDHEDIVLALVRAPNSVTPEQTAQLERALLPRDKRDLKLHVRTQITKETTSKGYLHEIEPEAPPAEDPFTPAKQRSPESVSGDDRAPSSRDRDDLPKEGASD